MYIGSAVRTPIGKFNGALKSVAASDLGITATKEALVRANLQPDQVEEVYFGNVISAGTGQAPARQVVIGSGMPDTTEATTINKVCASGLKAVMLATQNIQLGIRRVMVAGGMESMSNIPFYFPRGATYGNVMVKDGILHDGLTDYFGHYHMGMCAENTAARDKISRADQDAYTLETYKRAKEAWDAGKFKAEVVPVNIPGKKPVEVSQDEEYVGLKAEKVPSLKPAFKKDGGTVTAANASSINDGAAALTLFSADYKDQAIARVVAYADAATAPIDFTIAPSLAIPQVLKRAGLVVNDISKWEINEAFAAVAIANIQRLGLDASKVNVNGGAVALGHPIGASGARILVTLLHVLREGEFGVAAICNGGGGASAMVVQKLQ